MWDLLPGPWYTILYLGLPIVILPIAVVITVIRMWLDRKNK